MKEKELRVTKKSFQWIQELACKCTLPSGKFDELTWVFEMTKKFEVKPYTKYKVVVI